MSYRPGSALRFIGRIAAGALLAAACQVASAGTQPGRSDPAQAPRDAAADGGWLQNPGVLPIFSRPLGNSYSEWAARWWQWALQMTPAGHPLLDLPDSACNKGQTGKVWFLGGNLSGNGVPIARTCELPVGTSLFFPLIANAYFAFLNDPPETRTEAFVRSVVECTDAQISVTIDGRALNRPTQYLERSILFDVQLPADNLTGLGPDLIPELKLSPGVDFGYYLFLAPLKPGAHQIAWSARMNCPSLGGDVFQNIIYSVTVRAGRL